MPATIHNFDRYATQREIDEKIERAEIEAGWFFDKATRTQKAEFDATMRSLLGVTGPRWDRARDAARAKWRDDTAEARKLYERTVECLLDTGEVSSDLDNEWTALIDLAQVARAMAAE